MIYPLGIASDGKQLAIADLKYHGVWKFADAKLASLFQGTKTFRTPLNAVRCVAFDKEGNVIAGDSATRDVYRISSDGKAVPLTKGGIGIPMSIAVAEDGTLYVADLELHRIYKVPSAGGKAVKWVDVRAPRGIAFDKDGSLWAVTGVEEQVVKFDAEGKKSVVVKGRELSYPSSIAIQGDQVLVCDSYKKGVFKVSSDGKIDSFSTGSFDHPVSLAVHGENLVVADPRAKAIWSIDSSGKATKIDVK